MSTEVPKSIVDGLSGLNLDPSPPRPTERIWSADVQIDAVVHIAGFINQQRIPLLSDFSRHEMNVTDGDILDLALKVSDLSDMYQGMYTGTMRATRQDLLLLREVKRHAPHLAISERERELVERSYWDIMRSFRKEFRKERTPSNTRIWLEVLNPFNGLYSSNPPE